MKIVTKTMAAVVIIIATAPVYMTGRTQTSIIFVGEELMRELKEREKV
jgi:hypothetical protein